MSSYWLDCVQEAFDELGLSDAIPAEKWPEVAKAMESIAEMESEATGRMYIPNPETRRADDAERLLRIERAKVGCKPCGGSGRLKYNAGPWGVNTECDKCHGEGKHA